jgi:hypothetical protein
MLRHSTFALDRIIAISVIREKQFFILDIYIYHSVVAICIIALIHTADAKGKKKQSERDCILSNGMF